MVLAANIVSMVNTQTWPISDNIIKALLVKHLETSTPP